MNRLDWLKIWALGLGIPTRLFTNDRVLASIKADDVHGMISDMRTALYSETDKATGPENLAEANAALYNPMHQLEAVMIFQQYSNLPSNETVGWASESSMLDGM